MKRILHIGAVLLAVQATNAQQVVRGDVVVLTQQIRLAMPDMGSEGFVVPVESQLQAFQTALAAIAQGNQTGVSAMLSPYRYEWISFIDTVAAESLIVVRELTPIQRGWGTFIRNPRSVNDCSVEVPHPIWDTNTWELGIRTFLRMRARWFLMAGTHRYANSNNSSDVAHQTQTVFHRAHMTMASARAVQTHGFDRTKPSYASYAEVIISNGTTSPPAELMTLKSNYESRGMTASVFSMATYDVTALLGATTNVQGQWSNTNGTKFVHIEHDYPIRTNYAKLLQAVEAMNAVFGVATSVDEADAMPTTVMLDQNYPNPFNPSTTLSYELSVLSVVDLRVFDLLGREVAVLANEEKMPGMYSVKWNGNGMASGTYLYQLRAGENVFAKKMILLR